jgi:hypothetical protein
MSGTIISVIVGGIITDKLSPFYILKSIYFLLNIIIATIMLILISYFHMDVPSIVCLIFWFVFYTTLSIPVSLIQNLFSISFGGKYCTILNGITGINILLYYRWIFIYWY